MATEKRLIDANALVIEELLVMDRDYINEFASGVRKVMNAIRRLPVVDAVEVIRCKDCIYGITDEGEPGMCKCVESAEYDSEYGEWLGFVEYHTPDFYCAFGERKYNETD